MKIISFIVLMSLLMPTSVLASSFKAKCINSEGKFSKCKVIIENERLKIGFKDEDHHGLNFDIPGKKITKLSEGEYATRRYAAVGVGTLIRGPIALVGLLFKKKRDHIGIEYKDKNNQNTAALVEIKKRYGQALKTELSAISGLSVESEGKEDEKEKKEEKKEESADTEAKEQEAKAE